MGEPAEGNGEIGDERSGVVDNDIFKMDGKPSVIGRLECMRLSKRLKQRRNVQISLLQLWLSSVLSN